MVVLTLLLSLVLMAPTPASAGAGTVRPCYSIQRDAPKQRPGRCTVRPLNPTVIDPTGESTPVSELPPVQDAP